MNTRQLEYLIALDRERHFGRAAAALAVSQSALSRALRQIERSLGFAIVDRHQGGFKGFTAQGELVLGWARRVVAEYAELSSLGDGAAKLRGHVRVGVAPVAMPIVSLVTTLFNERHPLVTLSAGAGGLRGGARADALRLRHLRVFRAHPTPLRRASRRLRLRRARRRSGRSEGTAGEV